MIEPRADFLFFKRGVEQFPVGCKRHNRWGGKNLVGVVNFIRKVREILGGLPPRVYAHA